MFAVTPKRYCDHTDAGLKPLSPGGLDVKIPCKECGHIGENWVCLSCYEVRIQRTLDRPFIC